MAPWDLNETSQLVQQLFGRDQERVARESSQSVMDRQEFSSYHFSEAMRLSKAFERNHLAKGQTLFKLHWAGAEKSKRAFHAYMVKAGAHSLAAVQSLHAIPDVFSHAVYFASAQNLQAHRLDDKKISLPSVVRCLKQTKKFAALSDPLQAIQSGDGWSHLAAVSNISKYRSVVRAVYNEDGTGKRANARELHVSAFEWRGKPYAEVSLRELLEPEYDRLMKAVITLGHQLNACLRAAT